MLATKLDNNYRPKLLPDFLSKFGLEEEKFRFVENDYGRSLAYKLFVPFIPDGISYVPDNIEYFEIRSLQCLDGFEKYTQKIREYLTFVSQIAEESRLEILRLPNLEEKEDGVPFRRFKYSDPFYHAGIGYVDVFSQENLENLLSTIAKNKNDLDSMLKETSAGFGDFFGFTCYKDGKLESYS